MNNSLIGSRLFLLPLLLASSASAQNTWYVDQGGTAPGTGTQLDPYTSLQFAIVQAGTVSGDTLLVAPGDYVEAIDYSGKGLEIRSTQGADVTILRNSAGPVVRLATQESGAILEGFMLVDGTGEVTGSETSGGGIYLSQASLTVENCSIRDCQAVFGGGVYLEASATLVMRDCELSENFANRGGAIHGNDAIVVLEGIEVHNNTATDVINLLSLKGGGVFLQDGSLSMDDCNLFSNLAERSQAEGGSLWLGGTTASLTNSTISGTAGGAGLDGSTRGGALFSTFGTDLTASNCQFTGSATNGLGGAIYGVGNFDDCDVTGFAIEGGGIYSVLNGVHMTNSIIEDCDGWPITGECTGEGGGVRGGTYTRCIIRNNVSPRTGGGAYGATLVDCLIEGNSAGNSNGCLGQSLGGGGLRDCTATGCVIIGNEVLPIAPFTTVIGGGGARGCTLIDCDVLNNTVRATAIDVGGFESRAYGGGTLESDLTDCRIEGNQVSSDYERGSKGAGSYMGTAIGCRFVGNTATSLPHIPFNLPSSDSSAGGGAANMTLDRCEFFDNEADYGGGAWNCDMTHCSLSGNRARISGGAVSGYAGSIGEPGTASTLYNSVAWGNTPDQFSNESGSVSADYTDVQGGWPGSNNLNADPLFWSEFAGDLHLQPGSPCIDAGDPNSPNDPDGTRADMGALPFDPNHTPESQNYCIAKLASPGCVPSLTWSGTPTMQSGSDDFVVHAGDLVNQKLGMAFWSQTPTDTPFGGGTLCVAGPQQRTPLVNSGGSTDPLGDCSGSASFFFSQAYLGGQGLSVGDSLFTQWWFRDPAQLDGTGIGLSNAVHFVLQL